MKHKIAVTWEMCGYIEVEADSLKNAMEMVKEDPEDFELPDEWEYVDDSLRLSTDDLQEMRVMALE